MSATVTLVLGGARSGKSLYAEGLVEAWPERIYLATAEAKDAEMAQRIDEHQKRRGAGWQTVEEPLDLTGALKVHSADCVPVLVDCLTLWLANIMAAGWDVDNETAVLVDCLSGLAGPVILQVVFSGGTEEEWTTGTRGLGPRDIAINVALPEVDGRILSRAVSFKGLTRRDPLTETDIVEYEPVSDRIRFVCDMTANWAGLRRKSVQDRRIAVVLANYPNRDGRIGNGVGLDTPAGTVHVLQALKKAGYTIDDIPADGDALVARVLAGPTNDFEALGDRIVSETISMADYQLYFAALPRSVQDAVIERWGAPEQDPFFRPGEVDCGAFALSAFGFGKVAVCLQPARVYNIDPKESYHSPDLVPPHNYLAFYAWLRNGFAADAVVHLGNPGPEPRDQGGGNGMGDGQGNDCR
ncbi:MAG: bifunctional adenosylcobinamide kinase/adenosylcobinamide-phosphate guanylyltransferase [Rhodospirillales bacterium]